MSKRFPFLVLLTFFSIQANSAPVSFTDRSVWNTAIGGSTDWFVDFNGFTSDSSSFTTSPLDLGPFSLSGTSLSSCCNIIDVPPYSGAVSSNSFTTPAASLDVGGANNDTVSLLLDNPVTAFGAEFASGGFNLFMQLDFVDGNSSSLLIPYPNSEGFLGFTSSVAVQSILFFNTSGGGDVFVMDDVEAVSFTSIPAVPIPAAAWLFGTALIGLVGFSRRMRTA